MTNLELFTALGGISPENLSGAEELQNKPCVRTNRKMHIKRAVLIAAVAAVLLLLAGCAAFAWHWYTTYFSMQREEPLSNSQISYIHENAQDIHESQTCDGYTVELKSALADGQGAYITLRICAPDDVDLINRKDGERLHFNNLYAMPEGSQLPAAMTCRVMDDGDGKDHTANVVLEIGPGGCLPGEAVSFEAGSSWRLVLQDILIDCWDREYEQELLQTKYAGMTDFMFTDEEAARMHSQILLASGEWEFDVELTPADTGNLEMLTAPVCTKAVVTRKDRSDVMFYDTKDAVEEIIITSIQLHALGAAVSFEMPENRQGSDFPDYFCSWIDLGDKYNPLTQIVSQDDNFFVVLKDGTRIDFWQTEGAIDTAYLKSDSPIVLKDVEYLQLSDGTKLYVPAA